MDKLLTGEENLILMADLHHLGKRAGRQRAAELLRRFDLVEAGPKTLATYSGGMRRRLDLAMTLIGDPRIIFLDEPTTGLEPRSRRTMRQIIRDLAADGGHHPPHHAVPGGGRPARRPEAHRSTLAVIGKPDYRGEDPGLAQLYYQAHLDIFLTSLSAVLHATALIKSAGVPAAEFLPYAIDFVNTLSFYLTEAAGEIDEGRYPGELANVTMMGATADHIVGASRDAGIDLDLPSAVKSHYDRAIAAGHGAHAWTMRIEARATVPAKTCWRASRCKIRPWDGWCFGGQPEASIRRAARTTALWVSLSTSAASGSTRPGPPRNASPVQCGARLKCRCGV